MGVGCSIMHAVEHEVVINSDNCAVRSARNYENITTKEANWIPMHGNDVKVRFYMIPQAKNTDNIRLLLCDLYHEVMNRHWINPIIS